MITWLHLLAFLSCLELHLIGGTISSKDKKSKSSRDIQVGPVDASVFSNNLITSNIAWKEIEKWSRGYNRNISKNTLSRHVLGYVTPWNNHGYDVAKIFGKKFTLISPVWLQLKVDRINRVYIATGEQDVDKKWVGDVKEAGETSGLKVVPRVIFDGWNPHDFQDLVESSYKQKALTKHLIDLANKHELDGFVLEIWNQIPSFHLVRPLTEVVAAVGKQLRNEGLTAILVIPPSIYKHDQRGIFGRDEFNKLVDYFDAFSLMTYDYSNFQNPGPNSPLNWMRECVEHLVADASSENREKILLGLNLYGLDYTATGGSHILGKQYVEVISKYKPKISFDQDSVEHFFEYKTKSGVRRVFYPTLHSIHARIKLAEELNVGLSLWELGQGLDYFYDLF